MTLDSLDLLESKIQEAADRLVELAEKNAELEEQLQASEERFAALAVSSAGDDGGAAWRAEKAELKRRVDQLVERLEALLEA
jgi:hypothetical protein